MNKKLEDLKAEGSKPGAEEKVRKKFLEYFHKVENQITFGKQIEKIYDLLVSGKISNRDKAIVLGALLYFINPIDLIPDITFPIGFLDDMGIIALVYRYLSHRADEEMPPK